MSTSCPPRHNNTSQQVARLGITSGPSFIYIYEIDVIYNVTQHTSISYIERIMYLGEIKSRWGRGRCMKNRIESPIEYVWKKDEIHTNFISLTIFF